MELWGMNCSVDSASDIDDDVASHHIASNRNEECVSASLMWVIKWVSSESSQLAGP